MSHLAIDFPLQYIYQDHISGLHPTLSCNLGNLRTIHQVIASIVECIIEHISYHQYQLCNHLGIPHRFHLSVACATDRISPIHMTCRPIELQNSPRRTCMSRPSVADGGLSIHQKGTVYHHHQHGCIEHNRCMFRRLKVIIVHCIYWARRLYPPLMRVSGHRNLDMYRLVEAFTEMCIYAVHITSYLLRPACKAHNQLQYHPREAFNDRLADPYHNTFLHLALLYKLDK